MGDGTLLSAGTVRGMETEEQEMICPRCAYSYEYIPPDTKVTNIAHIHEQNIQELGQRVNSLETQLKTQIEINKRLVRDVDSLEYRVSNLRVHLTEGSP